MTKKKNHRKRPGERPTRLQRENAEKRERPAVPRLPTEERSAEAATVFWMLCALFTFCAEVVRLAAKAYLSHAGDVDPATTGLELLPYITLGIGVVSGIICLVLTPIVYRVRKTAPPRLVTLVVVLISLAPLATLLLQSLRS